MLPVFQACVRRPQLGSKRGHTVFGFPFPPSPHAGHVSVLGDAVMLRKGERKGGLEKLTWYHIASKLRLARSGFSRPAPEHPYVMLRRRNDGTESTQI